MPVVERLRFDVVSEFIKKLWFYRHNFNSSQRSVIALFLLCVVVVTTLHWLHCAGVLIFYGLVIYFTTIQCNLELQRRVLYRSESILLFIEGVTSVLQSLSSLIQPKQQQTFKNSIPTTKNGPVPMPQSDGDAGASQTNFGLLENKTEGQAEVDDDNSINDEIERFLNLVMRDFVQSWYKSLSPDPDVVEEIHEILYQAAIQVCKTRIAKLNFKKLVCDVVKLYQHHLSAYIVCKSVLKSQPKRRRLSTSKLTSIEDAFQQKYGFHEALENDLFEINYIRSLVDIVLVRLLPIKIHRCRLARALVTEILACNVVLPLIDKLSTREWIYEAVTEILSEESLQDITELPLSDEDTKQKAQAEEDTELLKTIDFIETSNENPRKQHEISLPDDRLLRKRSCFADSHKSNLKVENNISDGESCLKGDESPIERTATNDHQEIQYSVNPSEEINVKNNKKESPKIDRRLIIPATEEAGEAFEIRVPPNGSDAQLYTEVQPEVLTNDVRNLPANLNVKLKEQGNCKCKEINSSPLNNDDDDISEFKDANSGLTYPDEHMNGFLENTSETFSDPQHDSCIPISFIGPSLKPGYHQTKSVYTSDHSFKSIDAQPRRSNSIDIMSHSASSVDILSHSSSSGDFLSRSSSSVDLVSRSSSSLDVRHHSIDIGSPVKTAKITSPDLEDISIPEVRINSSRKTSLDSQPDFPLRETNEEIPHDRFYLDDTVEDAEDIDDEMDGRFFPTHGNWAQLASNIPTYNYESALANCQTDVKPDECKVLESKQRLFNTVAIPTAESMTDRGASTYTIYKIEFEAWYWANSEIVLRKGTVMRRFREFVHLQARLEDNPVYKTHLKDVKGPKRWMSLPFGNMDKAAVEGRRKYLEKFLQVIIEKDTLCNGEEIKEFLAYEGKSHIAFVRKAPELNVPRIDKMFVRTVSGVFGKIVTALPSITQDKLPSLSRKESSPIMKSFEETTEDEDEIKLSFGIIANEPPLMAYDRFGEDYLARIIQDEMPTNQLAPGGEHLKVESDGVCGITDYESDRHEQMPLRSEGDGCASPEPPTTDSLDERCHTEIPLARAVLDLGVRCLEERATWICRENVLTGIQIFLGRALDRWLDDQVTLLTSTEQCCSYMELLRETIWPNGRLSTEGENILSDLEKNNRKETARKSLKDFFPKFLVVLIGDEEMDEGIHQMIQSVESEKLNRHFFYKLIDLVLERLFPELTNQKPAL